MKLDAANIEIVSIEGQFALLVRLDRTLLDGIPELEPSRRSSRLKGEASGLDPLRLFLPNACEIKTGERVRAGELMKVYKAFAKDAGVRPLSVAKFNEAMIERGFEQILSNGTWWLDLRVRGEGSANRDRELPLTWSSSSLAEWAAKCCDTSDPCAREEATPLYLAFRQYCVDRGESDDRLMTQTMFGLRLSDAGIYAVPNHSSGKMERVGIRLNRAALPGAPDA